MPLVLWKSGDGGLHRWDLTSDRFAQLCSRFARFFLYGASRPGREFAGWQSVQSQGSGRQLGCQSTSSIGSRQKHYESPLSSHAFLLASGCMHFLSSNVSDIPRLVHFQLFLAFTQQELDRAEVFLV
jgi:hypothetical protein